MAAHVGRRSYGTTKRAFAEIELPLVPAIKANAMREYLYKKEYDPRFTASERHAIEIFFRSDCQKITGALPELRGAYDDDWKLWRKGTSNKITKPPMWWRSKKEGGKFERRAGVERVAGSDTSERITICDLLKRDFDPQQPNGNAEYHRNIPHRNSVSTKWVPLKYSENALRYNPADEQAIRGAQSRRVAREARKRQRQQRKATDREAMLQRISMLDTVLRPAIDKHIKKMRDNRQELRKKITMHINELPADGVFPGGIHYRQAKNRFQALQRNRS